MPPFKDEHVLIIAPGSQTTLAQLGLPESFTPARLKLPTRMFPAERDGEWEPLKIREKRILVRNKDGINHSGDTVEAVANPADVVQHDQGAMDLDEEVVYEEDSVSDEGAVYPIQNGRIQNWSCFFALLTHIYNTLSPPFHTPILVVAQPAWTLQDQETLVQFVFEKFKAPAFCLLDAALSICYAYATSTATIVDVGYNKCDITAVREFLINDLGRGIALPHCGGEAMTSRLLELLKTKEPSKEMAEQLKRSAICEILPVGTPMPEEGQIVDVVPNPATVASNGATGPGESQKDSTAAQGGAPRGPGTGAESGDAEPDRPAQGGEDEEGVLDVATIVASGKTNEFLAQKEREKANKAAAKKSALADAAAAAKQKQLPNSKRVKASFYYHERKALEDLASSNAPPVNGSADQHSGNNAGAEILEGEADGDTAAAAARREDRREERRRSREGTAYIRKEIEVGTERFEAASGGVLDQIADAIHRCILAVPEISKRSELWDSLVIVGNGSKVRGFRESLLATLNARYLISPSSATIFTSELPSNFTTPVATGANTPQPQAHHQQTPHHGAGVNPLLLAATTASNTSLAPPGQKPSQPQQINQQISQQLQEQSAQQTHQHVHSQTPTSIKFLKAPEYFPEWKEVGMEEAAFLGAQVAAKVVFVVDQGLSKGYMSRTEYNELGPQGIHETCM